MIGNWLKRKIQIASVRAAREDLERFNASLRGATDGQIGMVVAIATIIRLRLTTAGRLSRGAFVLPMPGDGSAELQLYLSGMVRQFQKMGQPSDAAGTMVWLHSMRALGFPEVRELGRDMWKELQRGFPYVSDALSDIEALGGNQVPAGADTACTFVPEDLAPFS
jgi:hypothetical protein